MLKSGRNVMDGEELKKINDISKKVFDIGDKYPFAEGKKFVFRHSKINLFDEGNDE